MNGYHEDQKLKAIIKAAKRDPDPASVFYFGNEFDHEGAVIIIKPKETADAVIKWLLNQKLTSERPIPEKENKENSK